jgi:hypothetical protein
MVVVKVDAFIFRGREQFIFLVFQSLNGPFDILTFMMFAQELLKAKVESFLTTMKGFQLRWIFSLRESEGIFE